MARKYLGCFMLMLAVAFAGCTCFSGPAPAEKHVQGSAVPSASLSVAVPSGPARPAAQASGEAAASEKPFDMSRARWVEYRMTGESDGRPYACTERLEYGSSTSGGAQTQSIRRTITSGDASPAGASGAGGLFNMRRSSSQSSTSSGALVPFYRIEDDDPILYADRIAGDPGCLESITVPEGTYECKKYAGSFKGSGATYWGAPGVPVPVKIYTAYDGATLELVGWG